ncbi:trypsin-like peptidase domain-containing protein [Streptomyces sp. NPDC058745]|uniref:trypsin-like peptidase domain-containing protein n=1 Tax=Streptomyces sp. NPDC058745 TaxID=3346621 RepID=UPI003697FB48
MEFDRIVQVRVTGPRSPGRAAFATGYLVAPRLLLTTAHVLGESPEPGGTSVTVCRPEADERRFPARVLWRRRADSVDAALVEVVPDPGWRTPDSLRDLRTRPPQRWGRLIGTRPHPVTVCGYPRMQKDGLDRRGEQLTGSIHPGSGSGADRYEVLSVNPTFPADTSSAPSATPWSGMSGAALLCGDLLTGVVSRDRQAAVGARLIATRTTDLLDDPEFRELVTAHTGWQPLAEPVEPDHLLAPAAHARDLRSPAMLLRADTEAVTFHGREKELRYFTAWCRNTPDPFAVHLITGPGGQGKTRLARHLAAELRASGWVAVQLRADLDDAAPAGPAGAGGPEPDGTGPDWGALDTTSPLLVVVDYAETLPRQVRRLITRLRHGRHRTRLLLLARAKGDWKTDVLGSEPDTLRILSDAPTLALAPLLGQSAGTEARAVAFGRATQDLSRLLGQVTGLPRTDWQALAERIRPPQDLNRSRYASALTLQMHALATLLQAGPSPVTAGATSGPGRPPAPEQPTGPDLPPGLEGPDLPSGSEVLPGLDVRRDTETAPVEALLLAHEAHYWEGTAASPAFRLGDLRPVALRRAVAAAALCGAATRAEAVAVTRQVRGLPSGREDDVAEWLRALYPPAPGRYWGSLQPDRLAEYHAGVHFTRPGDEMLAPLWAEATDGQQVHALVVLVRAAGAHVLGGRPQTATEVLDALGAAVDSAPARVRVLLAAGTVLPPHPKAPYDRPYFTALGLDLNRRLATAFRELAVQQPDAYGPELVETLNDIGVRCEQMDRAGEALTALDEAVELGRRFARVDPGATEPRLAVALRNRSMVLSRRGRESSADALVTAEEIVAIERRLLRTTPGADGSYLFLALYHLGRRLAILDRNEEALAPLEESVAGYRRLARDNPAYEPSLARLLTQLSMVLGDLGRWREEGALSRESGEIRHRRGLAFSPEPRAGLRRRQTRATRSADR